MTFFYMQTDFESFKSILNFSPVHEHLYTSGQPTVEQLGWIKEQGFSSIINVALTDASHHLPNEDHICLDLGLDYIHIPLLWECPSSSTGLLILDVVHHLVQEQKVWLHCAKNWRVACLMYLYRQYYLGIDIAQADECLQQIWQPNDTWIGWTHAVSLQLQARQSTREIEQLS